MKKVVLFLIFLLFAATAYSSTFYMSNRQSSQILKVDTETETVTVFTDGGLLDHAIGVRFNNDNSLLYVASGSNGKILRYDPVTALVEEVATGFRPPHDLVFDTSGYLYTSQPGVPEISRIALDGTVTSIITDVSLVEPTGLAIDGSGNFYVANGSGGNILKFSSSGTFLNVFASVNLTRPGVLYMDDEDNLFVSDRSTGKVIKYDLEGNVLMTISEGLALPLGMGIDSDGYLYVADRTYNYVAKYDSAGNFVGSLTDSLFAQPGFIAFENQFDPSDIIPEPLTLFLLGVGVIRLILKRK